MFPIRMMIANDSLGANALARASSSSRTSLLMGGMGIGHRSAMVGGAMCNNGPAMILASATLLQTMST